MLKELQAKAGIAARTIDREGDAVWRGDGVVIASLAGLAVVTGRRRVGKTRLLVEWAERSGGVYFVAESAEVQRRYLVAALAAKLRGPPGR